MSDKEHLLRFIGRESPVTLKVLMAFPPEQINFRPHPRSRSAGELAGILLKEGNMMRTAAVGEAGPALPISPPFNTWAEAVAAYENEYKSLLKELDKAAAEDLSQPFDFFGRQMSRADALWILLLDGIHHRGQFSVYLRLAGGKVPAIYGPSADEPV